MTTTREPTPLRTDFLAELWQNLSPYLGIAQMGLALVCLLAGGYPSLFWLLFVLGAVQSGLFTGPKGVLLNAGFAAAALTVPVLLRWGMTAGIAFHIGLVTLLLWALGYITHKSTTMLMNERAKFQRAEEELRRSHAELTSAPANQRQQARDLALLTEMGDFLQACPILEDTYAIIGYFTPRLLPFPRGVLYLGDESRDSLAAVSAWGGIESGKNAPRCTPAHCWALRREQIHWMDDSASARRSGKFLCGRRTRRCTRPRPEDATGWSSPSRHKRRRKGNRQDAWEDTIPVDLYVRCWSITHNRGGRVPVTGRCWTGFIPISPILKRKGERHVGMGI
jgi:hypothetical protein